MRSDRVTVRGTAAGNVVWPARGPGVPGCRRDRRGSPARPGQARRAGPAAESAWPHCMICQVRMMGNLSPIYKTLT
eukprot:624208-Hanusia_phi.AAC.1